MMFSVCLSPRPVLEMLWNALLKSLANCERERDSREALKHDHETRKQIVTISEDFTIIICLYCHSQSLLRLAHKVRFSLHAHND